MPSIKSRIINFILRRHLLKLKLRKPVFDLNSSINDFRRECEEGAAKYDEAAGEHHYGRLHGYAFSVIGPY